MKTLIAMALAGMAGTLCRYGLVSLPWPKVFPYGTLAVNLLGAFAAGFCFVWLNARMPQHARLFPVLFIGFFGAFTTFSTFMLDSARFMAEGHYALFALDIFLQNMLGLMLALGGMLLARVIVS